VRFWLFRSRFSSASLRLCGALLAFPISAMTRDVGDSYPHPAFFAFLLQTKALPPIDAWVTLGWPLGHAWVALGWPKGHPIPNPIPGRQRVASLPSTKTQLPSTAFWLIANYYLPAALFQRSFAFHALGRCWSIVILFAPINSESVHPMKRNLALSNNAMEQSGVLFSSYEDLRSFPTHSFVVPAAAGPDNACPGKPDGQRARFILRSFRRGAIY
jgi:hypothetical protein